MSLFSSVDQVRVDKFWCFCLRTSLAAANPFPQEFVCVCVSRRGRPCRQGGTCSSLFFSRTGTAGVGFAPCLPHGSSVPAPAKDGPRYSVPRSLGGEAGGWCGGRGEALGWRAVSSALAARKYWSWGLPVALQYCIAALVRLEIGPCRRSRGSGSRGGPPRHPHGTFHPAAGGLVPPTPINHCGGSN